MAAGRGTVKPERKSVMSPVKVSPVLAGPLGAPAGLAPGVRSSIVIPGSAATVTVVAAPGPERTRTSAAGAAPAAAMTRGRPSARALTLGRGGSRAGVELGASEQRRARSARAADGPPASLDGPSTT